jgi:hypothetical protein
MVGILKSAQEPKVPNDFFDLGRHVAVEERSETEGTVMEDRKDTDSDDSEPSLQLTKAVVCSQEEALPEGFFDDPLLDAKVRNKTHELDFVSIWNSNGLLYLFHIMILIIFKCQVMRKHGSFLPLGAYHQAIALPLLVNLSVACYVHIYLLIVINF